MEALTGGVRPARAVFRRRSAAAAALRDTSAALRHARPMVIDLDTRPSASETSRRGPHVTCSGTARPAAVVAVVLLVLALGGSAPPLPGLRHVLTVENTSGAFALTPTGVFTAHFGRSPGRQAIVRRHPLGPSPRWSTELPQTVGSLDVVEPARVLVVGPAQVLMTTSVDAVQTTFLDSGTGEILWSTRTDRVLRLADTGALMTRGTTGSATLRRADLRTGRTWWSRELGPGSYADAGEPSAGVVTVDRRGRATVLDADDGAVLATAELGVAPGEIDDDGIGGTAVYAAVGARLYLARRDDGEGSLTAYRLPDLRPLWRSTAALLSRPTWCGPQSVCVATAAGPTVLDSDTGKVRRSDSRRPSGFDTRAAGLPGPPRIAGPPGTGPALLDPATRTTLSVLGAGISLRSDRAETERVWVQVPGPRGGLRTIGVLERVNPHRCAATADYLACPTDSGRLTVRRTPGGG